MRGSRILVVAGLAITLGVCCLSVRAWTPLAVVDDPLVRMPGTQPGQVSLEGPGRCLNCHAGYNPAVEPGHNWKGSMMAQSARDFLFWACFTVAAQDSVWALGTPNATDICMRCHFPKGWLEGRSDPTNASLMSGDDFDGVQCDFCHRMVDPFFETTFQGLREGTDWAGYWDETGLSSTPSHPAALSTYTQDASEMQALQRFDGSPFFVANEPFSPSYTEAASGQYYVAADAAKRASFADAAARHQMNYSRFHKSKYFCATCHDVSNPILENLTAGLPGTGLPTESFSAHSYFHVERTFSEFMLSDYGQPGGAPGIGPFDPAVFETSLPGNLIGKCQDCHMRDVVGVACNKRGVPVRPTESVEHPQSGQPLHDLTGGNTWVSWVLASAIPGSPNHDPVNEQLLWQGPAALTLDLTAGLGVDPVALLDGVTRARQQLELAASIEGLTYDPASGAVSFRVQNQTGHRLISGFPEGRRMFVSIRAYDAGGALIHEVNPYDAPAGTLKGLPHAYSDPDATPLPAPAALAGSEVHIDELVYEMHPSSSLTGEQETFHFALADGRYKDNRIPPRGYRIAEAAARMCVPVDMGVEDPDYFTSAEYAGGYDEVTLPGVLPPGAARVEVALYYQTTSREYVEFLRDEINGTGVTLSSPAPSGEAQAYIAQSDPFFAQLNAWGDTIWQLWKHNKDIHGASPYLMTEAYWGAAPPTPGCTPPAAPTLIAATPGKGKVTLEWSDVHSADPEVVGYRIYYDQGGKAQLVAELGLVTTYTDRSLTAGQDYCYVVTAVDGPECESDPSGVLCAVPSGGGGGGGGRPR